MVFRIGINSPHQGIGFNLYKPEVGAEAKLEAVSHSGWSDDESHSYTIAEQDAHGRFIFVTLFEYRDYLNCGLRSLQKSAHVNEALIFTRGYDFMHDIADRNWLFTATSQRLGIVKNKGGAPFILFEDRSYHFKLFQVAQFSYFLSGTSKAEKLLQGGQAGFF